MPLSPKFRGLFNRSRIKRKSTNKYKRTDALTKASFSAIVPANYEHIDDKRMYRYDGKNSCSAFFAEPLLGGI